MNLSEAPWELDEVIVTGKLEARESRVADAGLEARMTGDLMKELATDCDQVVASAAMIGGISYFHTFAYDLIAENERITASTFDAAIWAYRNAKLKKITVVSSSMVFENAVKFPSHEGDHRACPPPAATAD